MNFGAKKVYLRVFVKNPKSKETLKSLIALFKKPAWRASSRDMKEKPSANVESKQNGNQKENTITSSDNKNSQANQ